MIYLLALVLVLAHSALLYSLPEYQWVSNYIVLPGLLGCCCAFWFNRK